MTSGSRTPAEGRETASAPPAERRRRTEPGSPGWFAWRWWDAHLRTHGILEFAAYLAFLGALGLVGVLWAKGAPVATDPWDAPRWAGGLVIAAAVAIGLAAQWALTGVSRAAVSAKPRRAPWARPTARTVGVAAATAVAAAALWVVRPLWHGVAILYWQYPLVTWIPLLAGAVPVAVCAIAARRRPAAAAAARTRAAVSWQAPVALVVWALAMFALPSLQGRVLYRATTYVDAASLPSRTQPRVLPKEAALTIGAAEHLRREHLVVDPASRSLVFSAERGTGGIGLEPLDRVDATPETRPGTFRPAVSATGPGSLTWRAYHRHFLTRVMERVIVPLPGGGAVAVAPYVGFKGFPVRHEFWQGVYVLHEDGRLEDLTPRQALRRPELVASGRLFPEKLARDVAEAYGYRGGPLATLWARRTVVSDPTSDDTNPVGNPQPYLTNLGDGRVRWVTVAHPAGDDSRVAAVFLTDSTTGRTEVWHPPPGRRILSNAGAAAIARRAGLIWTACCANGARFPLLRPAEPRPVFARGRFYYLVSAMPVNGSDPDDTVADTIVVDALEGRVARVFDEEGDGSDDALRRFLGAPPRPR